MRRAVIRALLPHDSRLTAHTLVPKATVSVPLTVSPGPGARSAHCAKTKAVLSDSCMAQSMDLMPAAALGGQGSEPIPGISSPTRRHCHNYPAIPFKCTATIATDRCSVPATVHSKAGAKHKT